ncbi:hypothetical protein ACQKGC_28225 [Allorhizobium pseudoryzae]|uniref:hypothetical protein n=1 Tax=Allorhizobium pseudoryzae TaxID=379684 RepID=UPI003D070472
MTDFDLLRDLQFKIELNQNALSRLSKLLEKSDKALSFGVSNQELRAGIIQGLIETNERLEKRTAELEALLGGADRT